MREFHKIIVIIAHVMISKPNATQVHVIHVATCIYPLCMVTVIVVCLSVTALTA